MQLKDIESSIPSKDQRSSETALFGMFGCKKAILQAHASLSCPLTRTKLSDAERPVERHGFFVQMPAVIFNSRADLACAKGFSMSFLVYFLCYMCLKALQFAQRP